MTCVGGTGIELVASSVSGQTAGVAACAQLGADHCEWSAHVRGCPAAYAAIVTQLDTQSPAGCYDAGPSAHGSGGGWRSASQAAETSAGHGAWTTRGPRCHHHAPISPLLTSAGSSEPFALTCGALSGYVLTCEVASRQLSLFPTASRRHVPRMCPIRAAAGLPPLALCRPGREQEHSQAAVDI
jgi:hypothetical protein